MSFALLLIDIQKDFFPGGQLACERALSIIPGVNYLIDMFRKKSYPVVHVTDSHLPVIDMEFRIWGSHAVRGELSSEILDGIDYRDDDYRVLKRRYSGFSGTDLDFLLIEKSVKNLVVCGIHTDICIRHTVYDAFLRGYHITVIEDAVEAFTQKKHEEGLEYLNQVYGARLLKSKDFSFDLDFTA